MTIKEKLTKIFSIYYDEKTLENIPDGFTGLCNKHGPEHLYEVFPIRKYLQENELDKNQYTGFFSPKFFQKTKITGEDIRNTLNQASSETTVCLFSSAVDEASLFPNVWIQGDGFHPGLLNISQRLAWNAGYTIDLKSSITPLQTAVFSHYFVAKTEFWDEWLRITDIYFDMLEIDKDLKNFKTLHRRMETLIHAFIIERIPTMIITCKKFHTFFDINLYMRQEKFQPDQAAKLLRLDKCKRMFTETKNHAWLENYVTIAREYLQEDYKT